MAKSYDIAAAERAAEREARRRAREREAGREAPKPAPKQTPRERLFLAHAPRGLEGYALDLARQGLSLDQARERLRKAHLELHPELGLTKEALRATLLSKGDANA